MVITYSNIDLSKVDLRVGVGNEWAEISVPFAYLITHLRVFIKAIRSSKSIDSFCLSSFT